LDEKAKREKRRSTTGERREGPGGGIKCFETVRKKTRILPKRRGVIRILMLVKRLLAPKREKKGTTTKRN